MNKNRIQKVEQPIIHLPWVNSMGVIGDPGCEGLGTYNMKVYAKKEDLYLLEDIGGGYILIGEIGIEKCE